MPLDPGEQRLIRLFEQFLEGVLLISIQRVVVSFQKAHKENVELEQTTSALPAQPSCRFGFRVTHSTRLSNFWRMWPMASAGLSPLGQTSVQFMMV